MVLSVTSVVHAGLLGSIIIMGHPSLGAIVVQSIQVPKRGIQQIWGMRKINAKPQMAAALKLVPFI